LVVGLAAGCSGAQGASAPDAGSSPAGGSPSPRVSSSPTASATWDDAARARIPKAARAHTPQGAEAFARFYLEQVNKAWMVPDPELIRPYAQPGCKTCSNFTKTAEWLRREQLRYSGPPGTLKASIWLPESTRDHVLVRVVHIQEARDILRVDGSVKEKLKRMPGESELDVAWSDSLWHISTVKGVE
jgi:hypothetical protein